MAAELMQVNHGRVIWHSAVGNFANMLPWGAAASIAAQLGACVTEIGKFKLESNRLTRAHAVISEEMLIRRSTIIQVFEAQRRASMQQKLTVDAFITGWHLTVTRSCDMSISAEDRLPPTGLASLMVQQFPIMAAQPGNQLIELVKTMDLSRTDREISAWRAITT